MESEFKALREEFEIRHVGNGKEERLIRTVNDRLRGNPELLAERQNKLFYQSLSALRVSNGKMPFERHTAKNQILKHPYL